MNDEMKDLVATLAFLAGVAIGGFIIYSTVTSLLAGSISGPLIGAAASFKVQGK